MTIEPRGPVAAYVQLADIIEKRIEIGILLADQPIPSEAALQQEFGIARSTVRRAMALLRERNLVYTVPQRGTYVRRVGE